MTNKEFLYKYLNSNSPVGQEGEGQKLWLEHTKQYVDDTFIDTYGTAVGIINPNSEYKFVIEAHADEISWYVNYITKEGYIYVIRNGGSDYQIAPSMRVKIHTDKGTVPGVFGWPAIHVRDLKNELKPEIKNIILDCGCESKEDVLKLGIDIGSIVTFDADVMELNNDYLTGRALDNRIGGFIISEVARKIQKSDKKLPFTLYIVNSVQEEVGLKGASMIANTIKPDAAIITDVTHDTQSPLYNMIKEGDVSCKKGPVIGYAPSIHKTIREYLIDIAKKNNIPFQKQANSRSTGTDTDAFAYSNSGIPSALISLPLKYMHTTVETVHKDDVTSTINLFYEFLTSFDFKLTSFGLKL